ncbi:MAG TPA: TetR family transcriptional regulator [Croceibacterium sp.]|jgi:TetR/AcrR family tetracycline transcriptional repressor
MAPSRLDRSSIVAAALNILTERGLAAVSLRNVAAAVGARAPSLYWHVKNKEALFGLMCEQIFRECLAQVPESRDWRQWLRNYGIVIWRKQREIRDIRLLMLQSRMEPEVLRAFTMYMMGELTRLGIDPVLAFDAQRSVSTLVTGWTMLPNDPVLGDMQPEPSFIRSLEALIRGWDAEAGR